MGRPKEANNIYSKERLNVKVSHSDFSYEDNFDYIQETNELNDYLLSKNWDKYFKTQKNGIVICDITIVNKIFDQCYAEFKSKMDSVQIFHIITDFYNISGAHMFNKLVQSHRMTLIQDLERRLGGTKRTIKPMKIDDKIQYDFHSIFKHK